MFLHKDRDERATQMRQTTTNSLLGVYSVADPENNLAEGKKLNQLINIYRYLIRLLVYGIVVNTRH